MTEIYENLEIKNETTFKIGGVVKKVAFPDTKQELIDLLKTGEYDIVLGSCSNVLFSSENCNKKIIVTKNVSQYSFDGNVLDVSCGVKGPFISRECQKRNLTGFEFLIGFPGSFGGMICMNSSAHNQSIADNFLCAEVYNLKTGEISILGKDEMLFSYRQSLLSQGNHTVLSAKFELKEGNPEKIAEMTERNIKFRKERQPSLAFGNAGSIFKNPLNDSAGRLLDLCGMKGKESGGARVYENHANFIININNAKSSDIINLMYEMYSKVKEKYSIELVPEIEYIGNEGTKEYILWQQMKKENTHAIQK